MCKGPDSFPETIGTWKVAITNHQGNANQNHNETDTTSHPLG